jgi:flagellar hook-associated protein 2
MDTDSTVKKLIEIEQFKVDRKKQDKQFLEWQQEDYREIGNLLRGFQDEYLDFLSPVKIIRSAESFNMFTGSASISGVSSSAVSIATTSNSLVSTFTIDSVAQMATKDIIKSGSEVLGNITGTSMGTIGDINAQIDISSGITFTLDGVTKTIDLDTSDYLDYNALVTDLNNKLESEFTNVDITAELTGGGLDQLEFKIYENGTLNEEPGHSLVIEDLNTDLLSNLGITGGSSNTVNLEGTLADVFGTSGDSDLTINGVDFTFTDTTTVADVINTVNASSAGVTLAYDNFTDKFTLSSTTEGTDSTISITDTSLLFADFKLDGGSEDHTAAVNAEFTVNGVATTRSSNSFEINGTSVTINEIPSGSVEIEVSTDTTDVKELIVSFVESYNELISKINEKTGEKRDYDYAPLTDAQKEELSDDEIENWQEQARKGTLENDTTINRITTEMRNALTEAISDVGVSLYEIGIQTSSNYKDSGKLTIDETKLDAALKEKPNEVIKLFTAESDTAYTDYDNRSTRYAENGLASRLHDVIQNNIRTSIDSYGSKGYLIEKAGSNDLDTSSVLYKKTY